MGIRSKFTKDITNKVGNELLNIEEIKNQVLKEHNNTVNFIDEPKAIQYKESLRLEIS